MTGGFRTNDRLRFSARTTDLNRLDSTPSPSRRRDSHGRGSRGPLLHPAVPAWLTRRERFVALVAQTALRFQEKFPQTEQIEFGVEEVPPSDPSSLESFDVSLARGFPKDRRRGLADRVVLYRLPIERATRGVDPTTLIVGLMADRTSDLTGIAPEDLFLA